METTSQVDLLHADWAVEWLRRPLPCLCCGGIGSHATPVLIEGIMFLNVNPCTTCYATGYCTRFSLN